MCIHDCRLDLREEAKRLIYEQALKSNLNRVKKDLDCYVNQVTGVAAVPSTKAGGLSKDEDGTVNIIYAIVTGVPMTVVERVDIDDYTVDEMAAYAKEFNQLDCGYNMSFAKSDDYYDVTIVGTRILQAANLT